jgi:hypothetical protein
MRNGGTHLLNSSTDFAPAFCTSGQFPDPHLISSPGEFTFMGQYAADAYCSMSLSWRKSSGWMLRFSAMEGAALLMQASRRTKTSGRTGNMFRRYTPQNAQNISRILRVYRCHFLFYYTRSPCKCRGVRTLPWRFSITSKPRAVALCSTSPEGEDDWMTALSHGVGGHLPPSLRCASLSVFIGCGGYEGVVVAVEANLLSRLFGKLGCLRRAKMNALDKPNGK